MEETTTTVSEPSTGNSQSFRGVITPHHLRTDEIAAIAVYEYREKERLGLPDYPVTEIKFYGSPECPTDKIEEFLSEGYLPIEIGEMSYKAVGAGSATEALVRTLGYDPTGLSAGEVKLMEILAQRNLGNPDNDSMDRFYMSLPLNLKNFYVLPGYDEVDIVTRYKDIVHAYLEYENRPEGSADPQIPDELTDLNQKTKDCKCEPFTPGRYLRDLCYRSESVGRIREKVQFFITAVEHCKAEIARTKDEWPRMAKLNFTFLGLPAAAIETENSFVSKVCFGRKQPGRVDLLIIQNPKSGHTAIMARKKNVSALYRELELLEPGRWYHHESAGNLLNGGPMYSNVTRTGQSLSRLASLTSRFPPR